MVWSARVQERCMIDQSNSKGVWLTKEELVYMVDQRRVKVHGWSKKSKLVKLVKEQLRCIVDQRTEKV